MKYLTPLVPFLVGWIVLLASDTLSEAALINGVGQLVLFGLVVCWPIWNTGRMSYVDIGWPMGLVLLGVLTFQLGDGYWLRVWVVSGVYVFVGLRMGLGALNMWRLGLLKKEFPRYQYQRIRWERAGKTNVPLALQMDALMQGLANASFLAFPALIIASNSDASICIMEILGLSIWVLAWAMESVADAQKLKFLSDMKKAGEKNRVCDVGLWRYSRHPNYFAEWMVWNSLVIASVPSWLALQSREHVVMWILLGIGLLFVSRILYITLVYATGAVPSEHSSMQKRPDYKAYQQRTNMFFPGPVKHLEPETD